MPNPFEAYREGYDKGRKEGLIGATGEAIFGLLKNDPGGHYAVGYRDGAAKKKFSPPLEEDSKSFSHKSSGATATPLEKAWYGLCNSSAFIPKHIVDYYVSALDAAGNHVAVAVGLHDFTGQACPKCKEEGQFKIKFLGRLHHPDCRWSGYLGTGSYIGFQLMQILHSGMRAGSKMKEDAKKPGDKGASWVDGIVGFLMTAVFRAALAVVLIPMHTIVAIFQPGQSGSDIGKRITAMLVFLGVIGFGIYKIQTADRQRFEANQPVGFTPTQPAASGPQTARSVNPPVALQPVIRPSFDCGKAHTSVELLICRNGNLAALENEMASTYHQTLSRLPPNGQLALREDHLAWFKNYSRTCNHSPNDVERSTCIVNYLSTHTTEMKTRSQ